MKLQNKIILFSIGFAFLIILTLSFFTDTWPGNGFCLMAGLVGMCGGAGYLLLGSMLLFLRDKQYSKGFFISALFLLVTGFIAFRFLSDY